MLFSENSIWVQGFGFMEIESIHRISAAESEIFRPLRGAIGAITCGCGRRNLTFVDLSTCPHLRFLSDTQCEEGCIGHTWSPKVESGSGIQIFPDDIIPYSNLEATASTSAQMAQNAIGFSVFARRLLSQGYMHALSSSATATALVRSDVATVMKEIAHESGNLRLDSGTFREVAEQRGWRPIFGIAADIPSIGWAQKDGDHLLPWAAWLWREDGFGKPAILRVSEAEMARAARRFSIAGNVTKGPYFFLGLWGAERVERLFLYPVAVFAGQIAPVDSHPERLRVCKLWSEGWQLIKPLSLSDLQLLATKIDGLGGLSREKLRYRPDIAALKPGTVRIEEIHGDLQSIDPRYAQTFDFKKVYFRLREERGDFEFLVLKANDLRRGLDGVFHSDRMPAILSASVA